MTTFFDALNRSDPNSLADLLRQIGLGQFLAGQCNQVLRQVPTAASTSQLTTVYAVGLPTTSRATAITRAYGRTSLLSTISAGELSVQAANATPTGSQIAVAPNGDIVVSASAGWSSMDVEYVPARGDVVKLTGQAVSSNTFTIPTQYTTAGVVYLLSATANTGSVTGVCKIVAPQATSPATTKACLNLAKTAVKFYSSDAVTNCDVTLLVGASLDLANTMAGADVM
jgi:hypothetical protein